MIADTVTLDQLDSLELTFLVDAPECDCEDCGGLAVAELTHDGTCAVQLCAPHVAWVRHGIHETLEGRRMLRCQVCGLYPVPVKSVRLAALS